MMGDAETSPPEPPRLVIVSNRLPLVIERQDDGSWHTTSGSGGLVTALRPALQRRGGVWIGWPGIPSDSGEDLESARAACAGIGFEVEFVPLSRQEMVDYYEGACNEVLWPLFHDHQREVYVEPSFWRSYREVNARFGAVAAAVARPGDIVWVHDYHLGLAGVALRAAGLASRLGYFLHIPFPAEEVYMRLP